MPAGFSLRRTLRWMRLKITTLSAGALGVGPERKVELFLDLSNAATLRDPVYWLQIVFASGIATLGLVLNSPAVIIGAMLISPLMNPILAAGLALASGDLVLGVRAATNLLVSCLVAILFAVVLVVLLPFREMTDEIAARTQPNILDLLIALFSGAVGSVAICRKVEGVVTSIPGVAIAVALMPPLGVIGYGIGISLMLDWSTGWRITNGGGLLFLTNLVAITLTAMLVFLILRIDTPKVRAQAELWQLTDPESLFVIKGMRSFPALERARRIHSLTLRAGMIVIPLIFIVSPLSSSFTQLQKEITLKRRESELRRVVSEVWQQKFQNRSDGNFRSSIDKLTVREQDGRVEVDLRVFDDEPYTPAEKRECVRQLADRLNRPVEQLSLNLVEIPTVSVLDSLERTRETAAVPTDADQKAERARRAASAILDLELPQPATTLRKQITLGVDGRLSLEIYYLSPEQLTAEVEDGIIADARRLLNSEDLPVTLRHIDPAIGVVAFDKTKLNADGMVQLDYAGRMMSEHPNLTLIIRTPVRNGLAAVTTRPTPAIASYLGTRWQIAPQRMISVEGTERRNVVINFDALSDAGPIVETRSRS